MNIGAILLTALFGLAILGCWTWLGARMSWTINYEARIFRAIAERNDRRRYRNTGADE